jgi:hypothetical protein
MGSSWGRVELFRIATRVLPLEKSALPTANPTRLTIARESVDNRCHGRSLQVDLLRRGRTVAVALRQACGLFDRHSVSFVSVTQQFNTTPSMGRLTLIVLLSFAQFEREVTSERNVENFPPIKEGHWLKGTFPSRL